MLLLASASSGAVDQVFEIGKDVTAPVLVTRVDPQYTPEARRAQIQGVVLLRVVVAADGTVHDVSVMRSLDSLFGLDQQAIKAARQWIYKPGSKDGKPVAVNFVLEMEFALR